MLTPLARYYNKTGLRVENWIAEKVKIRKVILFSIPSYGLGASEITVNLYCNCVHLYWEDCVIYSIYLR